MENRWQYEAMGSGESREELEGLIDDVEEDEWEVAPAATTQVDSIDGRSIAYSRRWRRVRKEGPPMKITIQVLIEGADVLPLTVPTHTIDRLCERTEEVGLQRVEAKSILRGLEQNVVRHQLAEYLAGKRSCTHCQRSRAIKGYHSAKSRVRQNPAPQLQLGLTAGIFGDAIARPEGRVALRSLPAKAYRKKALRKFSLSCAALIKSPNVGCATYTNLKVSCLASRSPSYPTAVIRSANSERSCIRAPSTSWIGFTLG
jgi:hypothetical protein